MRLIKGDPIWLIEGDGSVRPGRFLEELRDEIEPL